MWCYHISVAKQENCLCAWISKLEKKIWASAWCQSTLNYGHSWSPLSTTHFSVYGSTAYCLTHSLGFGGLSASTKHLSANDQSVWGIHMSGCRSSHSSQGPGCLWCFANPLLSTKHKAVNDISPTIHKRKTSLTIHKLKAVFHPQNSKA